MLKSDWTNLGIQTVDYSGGRFIFGCYGGENPLTGVKVPTLTLIAPPDFSRIEKVAENTSEGVILLGGRVWKALIRKVSDSPRRFTVAMVPAQAPAFSGLPK